MKTRLSWLTAALLVVLAGTAFAQDAGFRGVVELDEHRRPALADGKRDRFIHGGTLLTASHGTIENGSILIRDGKIAQMGPNLAPPPGVPVIEAGGKFITPGIIDAHSHIAVDTINEGTDSITAEVRIHDVLDPDAIAVYRALAGGVTSALILHGSANTIGGQSAVVKLKWHRPVSEMLVPDAPRIIKFALGENVKRSNGFRGDAPVRFPSTRMGVEAVLRRGFDEARRYRRAWDEYERKGDADAAPPRRDLRLETLSDILSGQIWVHCHAYRADEMLMLMRVAKDYGFKLACFQHALEAYKIAPELKEAGIGVSTFADFWAYKIEAWDAIPYNASLCRQAGIVTSINSDDAERMRRLNTDAAKSIKHGGLSPEEALRLVTLYPAQQLGIAHRTGTLDVGKDADLAIWDGHPLSIYSRPAMTLVEGEVFFQRRDAFGLDGTAGRAAEIRPCRADHQDLPLPRPARLYAITGGTVHPVSGPDIPGGTVLIADGKIQAVGAGIAIPAEAVRIDARGLHVYPGMIDAGSELGLTEIGSIRATDDTEEAGQGLQPDLQALTAVNAASEHFAITRFNGITSALVRPSGALGGQSAVINLAGWTGAEMKVKNPVALHVQFPRPLTERARAFLPADELARRQAEGSARDRRLRELFQKAKDYAARRPTAGDRVPLDARLEAMIPYVTGRSPVVFHADDPPTIRAAVKFAGDFGLKPIIAGGQDAWRVADLLKEKDIPVLYGPTYALPLQDYDPYDAPMAGPALLARAGVRFCFQSNDAADARSLPHMAGLASAYGLPKEQALRAVTLSAAEILGVADRMGSLEPGKLANVIVTDGDPLEPVTSLHYLLIDGKPVPLESRHTRLYETYRQRLNGSPAAPASAGMAGTNLPKRRLTR